MKALKIVGATLIAVLLSFSFVACSSDDDANDSGSSIVGVWAQDGDDDILVINANGTGQWYDCEEAYKEKDIASTITWTYKNGWLYLKDASSPTQEFRAETISKNKIVWKEYDDCPNLSYKYDGYDAFGYYNLWTWERYTK